MSDTPTRHGHPADFDAANPATPGAVRVTGTTRRGRECELIDNSGDGLPRAELESILAALVREDLFGFSAVSPPGGTTLDPARTQSAHIQIGDKLYRLLVHRYQARIERF
jgi:hypothetical protein